MAVAIASKAAAESTGAGTTLVITKPTGLAIGDLLVAFLFGARSSTGWATPSGWTLIKSANETSGNNANLTVVAKVADSGDAGASDFSFVPDGSTEEKRGDLYRLTGDFSAGIGSLIVSDSDSNVSIDTGVVTFPGGVTPIGISSLLMFAACSASGNTSPPTYSGWAVVSNNPSWTEDIDARVGTSVSLFYGLAYGDSSSSGATGNYSVAVGNGDNFAGVLVSISETVDVTVSPAVINMIATVEDPAITGDANITPAVIDLNSSIPDPVITTEASKVTNTDKSSESSITNTPKS